MEASKLKEAYSDAQDFLIKIIDRPDARQILTHYLSPPKDKFDHLSLEELYLRMLFSAQNANMKAGVIGGAIGGVENLKPVLFDFSPQAVVKEYGGDYMRLLSDIEMKVKPKGKVRKAAQSIWPKYCRTALESAAFLAQFSSGDDFYHWAHNIYRDDRSSPSLPLIISLEIFGVGYPLACDFLKELGFVNYGKPDVHIIDLFSGLGLCDKKASPYEIQKIILNMAIENHVSSYNVDKVFWLIGSGNFYDHPDLKNIGRNKKVFLEQFS